MRSGDVHRPDRPPLVNSQWSQPVLERFDWEDESTPEVILELGTTRSSYLRSTPAGREKMQANLRWYLYEHLGFAPHSTVILPYFTLVWTAYRAQ